MSKEEKGGTYSDFTCPLAVALTTSAFLIFSNFCPSLRRRKTAPRSGYTFLSFASVYEPRPEAFTMASAEYLESSASSCASKSPETDPTTSFAPLSSTSLVIRASALSVSMSGDRTSYASIQRFLSSPSSCTAPVSWRNPATPLRSISRILRS